MYFAASGSESALGKAYYLGASGAPQEVAANIADSNGIAVSLDGKTLYVAESRAHRLLAFSIASDGTLRDRRVLIDLPNVLARGRALYTPDGVRVDKHGRIYVGLHDGGGYAVFDPSGMLLRQIDIPGSAPCELGDFPGWQIRLRDDDERRVRRLSRRTLPGAEPSAAIASLA